MPPLSFVLDKFRKKFGYAPALEGCGADSIMIDHVTGDSRDKLPESVFCCIKGEKSDGLDYVRSAMKNGAVVLLSDRRPAEEVPWLLTDNVRRDMGRLASIVYGDPSSKLLMFAVTGTNGKSTTAWMIRHILQFSGIKTGIFGTIIYDDGSGEIEGERTTPESCDIQRSLSEMVKNGCTACVMEASSHGIDFGRLEGCSFDGTLFTNLSEEHLDYHKTIGEYFMAKKRLFSEYGKPGQRGVCNRDDSYGKKLADSFAFVVPFGLESNEGGFKGTILSSDPSGSEFEVCPPGGGVLTITLPLPGRFNVYNALGSLALLYPFIQNPESITGALKTMPQVPGRLERYFFSNGVCAVIDFAHTPTALKNVLSELKRMARGSLTAVFGHGGERFEENRPALGHHGAEFCEKLIITMDNPRSEDPSKIAESIMAGVRGSGRNPDARIILDRKAAVWTALDEAKEGDMVAITGKGPEKNILMGNRSIPYSDREAVLEWARERDLTWI
ncbi:MAG: UDP-N-acetylmuramoyl-L-alanyl-D-glutamate--2,6-diaminopimelate ligase [Aminivibrio sp.]|jgi:UDP-N-acetylmuramoyl-L-alanyl-D-glutamate--2,6-diaminopimelate ligase